MTEQERKEAVRLSNQWLDKIFESDDLAGLNVLAKIGYLGAFTAGYEASCEAKLQEITSYQCEAEDALNNLEAERAKSAKLAHEIKFTKQYLAKVSKFAEEQGQKQNRLIEAVRGALGWFALWNDEEDSTKWPPYVKKCELALAECKGSK